MVDERESQLPKPLIRNMFTVLMVLGVILYVGWLIAASIINGKVIVFDLGLYSITILMFLMGLTGRYLYGLKIAEGPSQD